MFHARWLKTYQQICMDKLFAHIGFANRRRTTIERRPNSRCVRRPHHRRTRVPQTVQIRRTRRPARVARFGRRWTSPNHEPAEAAVAATPQHGTLPRQHLLRLSGRQEIPTVIVVRWVAPSNKTPSCVFLRPGDVESRAVSNSGPIKISRVEVLLPIAPQQCSSLRPGSGNSGL